MKPSTVYWVCKIRTTLLVAFFSIGVQPYNLVRAQSLPPLPPIGEPLPVSSPDLLLPLPGLEGGETTPVKNPSLPPLPSGALGDPVAPLGSLPSEEGGVLLPAEPVTPSEDLALPAAVPEPLPLVGDTPAVFGDLPNSVMATGLILPQVTDNAGLLRLLEEVRNRSRRDDFEGAQALSEQTLRTFAETAENAFYLRQVRREQTNLYYRMAHQALKEKKYSLASQYLGRYQKNITRDSEDRKRAREVRFGTQGKSDVSLVGKLVEELDQAKKELAEIRAKSGLPESDAKVDYERIMAQEQLALEKSKGRAERLLKKAQVDAADGQYELARDQVDEALSLLPKNVATIALMSDLYKTKQQIIWYRIGEEMQKGRVGNVQTLVLDYQDVEKERRREEVATLGIEEGPDFEGEMQKAREKAEQQAELAEKMLAKAKGNVRAKEYGKAEEDLVKITNYLEPSTRTWSIILEAAITRNQINLEKAEDARKAKDWELANQYTDAYRTGLLQDRNVMGAGAMDLGRPGLESTKGKGSVDNLMKRADRMRGRIEADMEDPYERHISEFSPNREDQLADLAALLMRAKVQFINSDLTGAQETYRLIEARYSDNYEAKSMLQRIALIRQEESYLGYLQTRESMLEEINREWERPKVFERQIDEVKPVQETGNNLLEKLKTINVPAVQFFESPLPEVVAELQRLAKQFDFAEADPINKGVNIVVLNPAGEPPPNVTITLNGMALDQMISFITEQQGWTFDVRKDAVVLSKTGAGGGRPIGLETEFYEVSQGTIQRMTGGGGGVGGAGGVDPFAPPGAGAGGDDVGGKIRGFLEQAGIPFEDARGHKFVFDGFQMIVTHERRFLDLIERILERLDQDSSRQVEIETKFLEVQEGALDEISFDWQMAWENPHYILDPKTGNPLIDSRGAPIVAYDKNLLGNTRTLATGHSPTGLTRDTIISFPDNPDASLQLPNPIPRLPGKIGIGEGVTPLVRMTSRDLLGPGAGMILGGREASLLINALKRKQGTDLLSAPRVTVMDGQPASITIAQEFIYPTDWQPAPAPTVGGGGGGGGGNNQGFGGGIQIAPAIPQFDTVAPDDEQPGFREVGVVLDVTPRIEKYNSIALELNPKVTEFDGFIEYGGQSAMIGSPGVAGSPPVLIQPSGILMPIFSVRKVNTTVTIFDGATVIIGGLTREEVKTVNDKIPVLGNLPLIGKLFQSKAESYQKRNLLIFVSASIVSRGGSPVREVIQNIGPQSIFKDPVIMTPTGTIRRTFKGNLGVTP
jgi:general secretion pathway protein D